MVQRSAASPYVKTGREFKPGNPWAWPKGKSQNPGGRSKKLRQLQKLAVDLSEDALREIHQLATKSKSEKVRLETCRLIVEQALGRPAIRATDQNGNERPLISAIANLI